MESFIIDAPRAAFAAAQPQRCTEATIIRRSIDPPDVWRRQRETQSDNMLWCVEEKNFFTSEEETTSVVKSTLNNNSTAC